MNSEAKTKYLSLQKKLKQDQNNVLASLCDRINTKAGPLAASFYTLKDNFATRKEISSASSKTLDNFIAHYDATIVKLLDQAGATLVAKVRADEFGLGGTGKHSAFGLITNPLDAKRLVGGSSSGSVASMHYGFDFSIGSDTGDSVRLPASFNGFVGFKPSYGLISRYGLFSYASSLDTVAYFTNSVKAAHCLTQVLVKKDIADMNTIDFKVKALELKKPKRVAYLQHHEHFSEEVKKAYQKLLKKLAKDNIELIKSPYNTQLLNIIKPVYDIISYVEACSNLANITGFQFGHKAQGHNWKEIMLNLRSDYFGDVVQRRLTLGSYFSINQNIKKIYHQALALRNYYVDFLKRFHNSVDCFIYPSSSDIAPLLDDKKEPNYMDWIVTGANLGGNPSITLKWIKKQNLPIGLTIDAKRFHDNELLNYAYYFETKISQDKELHE